MRNVIRLLVSGVCVNTLYAQQPQGVSPIDSTLDTLHEADARADGGSYFSTR